MQPTTATRSTMHKRRELIPALSAGFLIGVIVVIVQVSYAAMIFSGSLDTFVAQGIGILLFGTLVLAVVVALASSFRGAIANPQDTSAAILAVVGAAIVAAMPDATPETQFATVVAAMMLSALLAGLFFWLLGQFNLGRLVRFVPYPVVGGFLAGVGWLIVMGAIGVMTESAFGLSLLAPSALTHWLPGLLLAVVLLIIQRRSRRSWLLPVLLLVAIGVFYLFYFLINGTITSAAAGGWLLGPFPQGSLWQPATSQAVTQADWSIVLRNAVNLSTIALVGAISLLLNASSLEIATHTDIDLNRELKAAGTANMIAAIGGSSPGYHSLSMSTLSYRMGGTSRLTGLFAASIVAFIMFFGADLLSIFPRMVAGGFLLYLGLSFLTEWLYDAWFKLPIGDYLLIWLILIAIASIGLLEGVTVGIFIAVVLFVITYTRSNVIRHTVTGENYQSHVMRTREYEQLLLHEGSSYVILELQGFIFFGTAHRLVDQIKLRLEQAELPRLRFLLLDFRLVTGIDSSAMLSFAKLRQLLGETNMELVLTHMTPTVQNQLEYGVFSAENGAPIHFFPDLDLGVAWIEEQLIATLTPTGESATPQTLVQYLEETLPSISAADHALPPQARIRHYMRRIDVAAGEVVLEEGAPVPEMYFVEDGKVVIQATGEDGTTRELRIQEVGTVFGEIGVYTGQTATATVVARDKAVLYALSLNDLTRMEKQDPELALAVHRLIARILGRKLTQANRTLTALQK